MGRDIPGHGAEPGTAPPGVSDDHEAAAGRPGDQGSSGIADDEIDTDIDARNPRAKPVRDGGE